MSLKAGDQAPEIELFDQDGQIRRSKDLKGKKLVLFFYPKDDSPGCTMQACGFRDNYESFKRMGAEVWGVSADDSTSHQLFSNKYKLNFPLLIDTENKLRKIFKVKSFLNIIPGRVSFIIDEKGIIRKVFDNLLNGPAHIEESLKAKLKNEI